MLWQNIVGVRGAGTFEFEHGSRWVGLLRNQLGRSGLGSAHCQIIRS